MKREKFLGFLNEMTEEGTSLGSPEHPLALQSNKVFPIGHCRLFTDLDALLWLLDSLEIGSADLPMAAAYLKKFSETPQDAVTHAELTIGNSIKMHLFYRSRAMWPEVERLTKIIGEMIEEIEDGSSNIPDWLFVIIARQDLFSPIVVRIARDKLRSIAVHDYKEPADLVLQQQ